MKEFLLTVTADGTLVLPSEVCEHCGPLAVLIHGKDNGIAIYPARKWQKMLERMNGNLAFAKAFRVLVGTAVEVDMSGGTLKLPPHLLQFSGICNKARVLLSADGCLIEELHNG